MNCGPAKQYRPEKSKAELAAALQEACELLAMYRGLHPAFRTKPVGAPNSIRRAEQNDQIELEDRVNEFLTRF